MSCSSSDQIKDQVIATQVTVDGHIFSDQIEVKVIVAQVMIAGHVF